MSVGRSNPTPWSKLPRWARVLRWAVPRVELGIERYVDEDDAPMLRVRVDLYPLGGVCGMLYRFVRLSVTTIDLEGRWSRILWAFASDIVRGRCMPVPEAAAYPIDIVGFKSLRDGEWLSGVDRRARCLCAWYEDCSICRAHLSRPRKPLDLSGAIPEFRAKFVPCRESPQAGRLREQTLASLRRIVWAGILPPPPRETVRSVERARLAPIPTSSEGALLEPAKGVRVRVGEREE